VIGRILPASSALAFTGFYDRVVSDGPFQVEYSLVEGLVLDLASALILVNGKARHFRVCKIHNTAESGTKRASGEEIDVHFFIHRAQFLGSATLRPIGI
jgi:hypothetical protein